MSMIFSVVTVPTLFKLSSMLHSLLSDPLFSTAMKWPGLWIIAAPAEKVRFSVGLLMWWCAALVEICASEKATMAKGPLVVGVSLL